MKRSVFPALLLALTSGAWSPGVSAGTSAREESAPPIPRPPGRWAEADARALSAPPALAHEPRALAAYLSRGAASDTERARSIFRWIAENIAYDYGQIGETAPISGAEVLVSGRSICDGYASAFELLGTLAGLQVVTIHGWAKGYDWVPGTHFDRPNHAWNAVWIDGAWRLIDSTWGAGYVRDRQFVKELDDYFFMPAPEALAFTHLAEDPRWALVPRPLDLRSFEAQPVARASFFRAGFSAADAEAALRTSAAHALVDVFLTPDQPLAFRSAPAQGVLSAGRSYRFELTAPAGTRAAAVNGGRWQYLRWTGGVLATVVTARPGELYLVVRTPTSAAPGYSTVLKYSAR